MEKRKEEVAIRSSAAEYLTYIASVGDDETAFEVRYQDENIWLTQKMMSILYDVKVNTINYHISKHNSILLTKKCKSTRMLLCT